MESVKRSAYFYPTEIQKKEDIFLCWSGYRHCAAGHVIGWRELSQYELVMVVSGSGVLEMNAKRHALSAGDVFMLFPNVAHYYHTKSNDAWHLKWVAFDGTGCVKMASKLGVTPADPVLHDMQNKKMIGALDNIVDHMIEERATAAMGWFYILYDEIMQVQKYRTECTEDSLADSQHEMVKRILLYLTLNYHKDINVDSVCLWINYSRSYVSHLFKKETGISIPMMINNIRLEKAADSICKTQMNIAEIAKAVGYKSNAYFTRLFLQKYGITPSRYREHAKRATARI